MSAETDPRLEAQLPDFIANRYYLGVGASAIMGALLIERPQTVAALTASVVPPATGASVDKRYIEKSVGMLRGQVGELFETTRGARGMASYQLNEALLAGEQTDWAAHLTAIRAAEARVPELREPLHKAYHDRASRVSRREDLQHASLDVLLDQTGWWRSATDLTAHLPSERQQELTAGTMYRNIGMFDTYLPGLVSHDGSKGNQARYQIAPKTIEYLDADTYATKNGVELPRLEGVDRLIEQAADMLPLQAGDYAAELAVMLQLHPEGLRSVELLDALAKRQPDMSTTERRRLFHAALRSVERLGLAIGKQPDPLGGQGKVLRVEGVTTEPRQHRPPKAVVYKAARPTMLPPVKLPTSTRQAAAVNIVKVEKPEPPALVLPKSKKPGAPKGTNHTPDFIPPRSNDRYRSKVMTVPEIVADFKRAAVADAFGSWVVASAASGEGLSPTILGGRLNRLYQTLPSDPESFIAHWNRSGQEPPLKLADGRVRVAK